ncbi:hypothetical protein TNCT_77191 [Trichonephila clavata]|uniref:Uncharacterized protein n=1 Tax=Trichonephila clavata TaxID=2740835 RepID=A0A8X6KW06_TRICU|nr:hypothetical protein TNCT_77191 [Trichonephila clavata]
MTNYVNSKKIDMPLTCSILGFHIRTTLRLYSERYLFRRTSDNSMFVYLLQHLCDSHSFQMAIRNRNRMTRTLDNQETVPGLVDKIPNTSPRNTSNEIKILCNNM